MARGRMINQTIDFDPEFNALSMEAQLLYLRTLAFLDRDGLITGHAHALVGKVAPLMQDVLPQISGIIQEWVEQGLVIRYPTKSGDVLFFKGFGKNQSGMHYDRETPSRFSPPPGWTHGAKGLIPIPDKPLPFESGATPEELRIESGVSPAQSEVKDQVKDQIQLDDDDDAQARAHLESAWLEAYEAEMPPKVREAIAPLMVECGEEAVLFAIQAGADAKSRTFAYIAKTARNYIPTPPAAPNGHPTNGYAVDIPGVHVLPPAEKPTPVALPPPLATDDPWTVALAEILPTLTQHAAGWLKGSTLTANGELAGVPLYRVTCETEPANIGWLSQKAEPLIRKTLSGILRKRLIVEIVAAEKEPVTP